MLLAAGLPWYDLPQCHSAWDAFWNAMRQHLLAAGSTPTLPDALDRQTPAPEQWQNRAQIISQCCGLDLFTSATAQIEPIARPIFATLDCPPGSYYSVIVTAQPLRKPNVVAANGVTSYSGYGALQPWLGRRGTRQQWLITGSHAASVQALHTQQADLAAIDARTWQLLGADERAGLHIVGRTRAAPTPPFVAHRDSPVPHGLILGALAAAATQVGAQTGISGVLPSTRRDYAMMR